MVKKSTHVGCNVRGAVSIAGVNGSYILQERGHIHSKHTMFFIHENGLYTLARFKIEGKYGWIIGQDRKALYGIRTEELYPPQKGWKTVQRGTFSGTKDADKRMTVVVVQHTMAKGGNEVTVVLNRQNKDTDNFMYDAGGKPNEKKHILSYALMEKNVANLHPRLDVYIDNFENSGRKKILYKEKIPLSVNTGQHCCFCCPSRMSKSDLPPEYGVGIELYFQFLKWLYCTFFILLIIITPTLYIILKTGEYDQSLSTGIGALAIPTLGNLGEGEAICADSNQKQPSRVIVENENAGKSGDDGTADIATAVDTTSISSGNRFTLKCPVGEIGYVQAAYFGHPSGLCGCPEQMLPDTITGECPHAKDISVTPAACKSGEFCLLSNEPTLGTECCASTRSASGRPDFSAIRPAENKTCGSTFAKDIVEGICYGRKICQINVNPYTIYNWTTKISTDKVGRVPTCKPELVTRVENVPVLSTTGGKDEMEERRYCAASFGQSAADKQGTYPNLKTCLNATSTSKNMRLIVVATCFETNVNLDELGNLGFSTTYSKQYLQFVMSGLDMIASIVFISLYLCLRKSENNAVEKIKETSTTVAAYTVFFQDLPPNKYKDHNELRHRIRDVLERNLEKGYARNLTSAGPSTDDGSIHIHQIKLGFNHSRLIDAMTRRGKILRRMELELNKETSAQVQHKVKVEKKMHEKIEKQIEKLQKIDGEINALEKTTHAVCAFITFEDEEGVARALDMYPNTCCHRTGCCWKKELKLEYEGKYYPFAFREPKGPTEVIWENCEVTAKQRCFRNMGTSFLSLLLILSTFLFVVAAKNQKAAVDRLYPPTVCDRLNPPTKKQVIADEFFDDPKYNVTRKQGHLACYCTHLLNEAGPMQEETVYSSEFPDNGGSTTWCVEWLQGQAQVQGFAFLAVAMVVIVNTALNMIMRRLVVYEKHSFITDMFSSLTTKLFIAKFLNTAIVVVIVNASLEIYDVVIDSPTFPLLAGAYNDFNMRWYFYVGAPIIMTVVMNSATELLMPFALKGYQYYKIYKDRYSTGNKLNSKKETQYDYEKLFTGGNFLLADQYASCLNTVFVVLLYSGGMPVLIFLATIIFWLKYKIEKWAFLRFYKTPPSFDESIAKNAQTWLPYAGVLHLLFATWMFTNPDIFGAGDTTSFSKMADAFFGRAGAKTDSQAFLASASASGGSAIFGRAVMTPHLVLLGLIFLVWLLWERLVWKLIGTFLSIIFPCLSCSNSYQGNSENLSYSEAKREKILKGLPNYNMEINPTYIDMFALDVVSAHKFVRRIGKPSKDYKAMGRRNYKGKRNSLQKEQLARVMEEERRLEMIQVRRANGGTLPDTFQSNPLTHQNPMHKRDRDGRGGNRARSSMRGRGRGRKTSEFTPPEIKGRKKTEFTLPNSGRRRQSKSTRPEATGKRQSEAPVPETAGRRQSEFSLPNSRGRRSLSIRGRGRGRT